MAYKRFNGCACLRRAETLEKERLQSRFRGERAKFRSEALFAVCSDRRSVACGDVVGELSQ